MRAIDLSGQKLGKLTVLYRAKSRTQENGKVRGFWLCRCDCGVEKEIGTDPLRSGASRTCGCGIIDAVRARSTTHGATVGGRSNQMRTREYRSWCHAKGRCHCITDAKFYCYGARGIVMCERWRNDFSAFLSDMGPCPQGLTLERKDVNGNYEPGNCRWATRHDQARNRTDNIFVKTASSLVCLKDFCKLSSASYKRVHFLMKKHGMTPYDAVKKAVGPL